MPVDDLFEDRGERAVELSLHVQPGAGRSAVVGRHGTSLKVRIAAPPVGGRANSACVELLAETFGVRADQIELTSGETSRSKRFRISDIDVDEFRRQLEQAIEPAGVPARPPSQVGRIRP